MSSWGSIAATHGVGDSLDSGLSAGSASLAREEPHRSLLVHIGNGVSSRNRVLAFGRSTRARFEELEGCVRVSYRVAEVVRRHSAQRSFLSCFHGGGERGLAQSGRPRRANKRRASNRDGKIVRSMLAKEGTGNSVVVFGFRVMKGVPGRSNRLLFTRGRGKRPWPTSWRHVTGLNTGASSFGVG